MPVRDLLNAASSQGGSAADPYFNYVGGQLNGDGTNGATNNTFIDSSTNNYTITRTGNATQGSFSPYGNLWSNYFDGSSYITSSASSIFNFGTGDFTIECWYYLKSTPSNGYLLDMGGNGTRIQINGVLYLIPASGNYLSTSSGLTVGVWNHVAMVRQSGTLYGYINGVSIGSISNTSNLTDGQVRLGDYGGGGNYYFPGYISNFRIVKGTAVYPNGTTFIPSTTPLTAITNTIFLTCQSNRIVDNSSNAFALTTTGTPEVTRFSPFNPTTAYDSSVLGGSMVTTDSSSYISYTQGTYTGSVTMEGWVYLVPGGGGNAIPFGNSSGNYAVDVYQPESCIIWYIYYPQGTNGIRFDFTGDVKVRYGEWMHIAFVRNGTSIKLYFNGVDASTIAGVSIQGSTTNSLTMYNSIMGSYDTVGGDGGVAYYSDLRVSASAVYTSNFTPPTAPIGNTSGTQVRCNFINAGLSDLAMQNDWQTLGGTQVSTAQKKFGTGSIYINSGSLKCYPLQNAAGLAVFGGDFTFEYWFYPTNGSNNFQGGGLSYRDSPFSSGGFQAIYDGTSGNMTWYFDGGGTTISGNGISNNTWNYIALVRQSGTLSFYVNGTRKNTASYTTVINGGAGSTLGFFIGDTYDGNHYYVQGYMDDVRITNGYARYLGTTMTVPTAALPTY